VENSKSKTNKRPKFQDIQLTKQEYQTLAKQREPARQVLRNCLRAYLVGGGICVLGQCLTELFIGVFHMTQLAAGNPTAAILILISVILTSLGVYDKIAQWAGAGTAVPVTGFANSMCSAALESRSEGIVLGVASNMFRIAGSVIVFGAVAAFVVAIVYMILGVEAHTSVTG
jgi:stage V sporulation protein AC